MVSPGKTVANGALPGINQNRAAIIPGDFLNSEFGNKIPRLAVESVYTSDLDRKSCVGRKGPARRIRQGGVAAPGCGVQSRALADASRSGRRRRGARGLSARLSVFSQFSRRDRACLDAQDRAEYLSHVAVEESGVSVRIERARVVERRGLERNRPRGAG